MLQTFCRILRILTIALRFRLDVFLPYSKSPWYIRYSLGLLSGIFRPGKKLTRGARLRLALESLGPIFVKFGQILSTRRDLLDDDIANELAKLQDQVPPFASDKAKLIIEQALGQPVDVLFSSFTSTPLASASIAQVHRATLHNGADVVVKVIRPTIEKTIQKDIALLYLLAKIVRKVSADGRRLKPVEVVQDYEYTVLDELDLMKEAANTTQLKRNFADSDLLYVPEVHWDYCRENVMVVERIQGIPVANIDTLHQANVDMKTLAERGVEIFFSQVFDHSFFHADMHPGNIFVDATHPKAPKYIAIDCAIMGSLTDEDKSYLARNLLAFFKRDYRMVAQLHVESGWVPKETPVHAFETAIRSVCEPMFAKPLKEISFGQVLIRLFQTARRFNMEVQPQLVLLEKTMLNIEGLGRQLYPDLDLWETGQPFIERWLANQVGPARLLTEIKKQAPQWAGQLPQVPSLFFSALQKNEQTYQLQQAQQQTLQKIQAKIESTRSNFFTRLLMKATGCVALLAAWLMSNPNPMQELTQIEVGQLTLLAIGICLLVLKP